MKAINETRDEGHLTEVKHRVGLKEYKLSEEELNALNARCDTLRRIEIAYRKAMGYSTRPRPNYRLL